MNIRDIFTILNFCVISLLLSIFLIAFELCIKKFGDAELATDDD